MLVYVHADGGMYLLSGIVCSVQVYVQNLFGTLQGHDAESFAPVQAHADSSPAHHLAEETIHELAWHFRVSAHV